MAALVCDCGSGESPGLWGWLTDGETSWSGMALVVFRWNNLDGRHRVIYITGI